MVLLSQWQELNVLVYYDLFLHWCCFCLVIQNVLVCHLPVWMFRYYSSVMGVTFTCFLFLGNSHPVFDWCYQFSIWSFIVVVVTLMIRHCSCYHLCPWWFHGSTVCHSLNHCSRPYWNRIIISGSIIVLFNLCLSSLYFIEVFIVCISCTF